MMLKNRGIYILFAEKLLAIFSDRVQRSNVEVHQCFPHRTRKFESIHEMSATVQYLVKWYGKMEICEQDYGNLKIF